MPVDTGRIFDGDYAYVAWVSILVERVSQTRSEINEKERADMLAAKSKK